MGKQHHYSVNIRWTGNKGTGTSGYQAYERSHSIHAEGKAEILASSDPAFRGDASLYNPEEMLVASLASCHMLWFLHLAADAGVVVTHYIDDAKGLMEQTVDGGGRFVQVTLYPHITVTEDSMVTKANELHKRANELCFIAQSVNFPVHHEPVCTCG